MIRVFDYLCSICARTQEEFISNDRHTVRCNNCGGVAIRQLAAPRTDWRHMGLDPAFTSAWDKWGKAKRAHHATDKGGSEKGQNLKMY